MADHIRVTGSSHAKILTCDDHSYKRRVKEAIAITKDKLVLNHYQGLDIPPPIYNQVLSCVSDLISHGNREASKTIRLEKDSL